MKKPVSTVALFLVSLLVYSQGVEAENDQIPPAVDNSPGSLFNYDISANLKLDSDLNDMSATFLNKWTVYDWGDGGNWQSNPSAALHSTASGGVGTDAYEAKNTPGIAMLYEVKAREQTVYVDLSTRQWINGGKWTLCMMSTNKDDFSNHDFDHLNNIDRIPSGVVWGAQTQMGRGSNDGHGHDLANDDARIGNISCHMEQTADISPKWDSYWSLSVTPVAAYFGSNSLAAGVLNQPYNQKVENYGIPGPTVQVTRGQLPDGLKISDDGTISGTPTRKGSFLFVLSAKNTYHHEILGHQEKQYEIEVG